MKYIDLIRTKHLTIAEHNAWAASNFHMMIKQSPFKEYFLNALMPDVGISILIIPAWFNEYDMILLDHLTEALNNDKIKANVYVADYFDVKSLEDLSKLIPGISDPYHTPYIGIWKEGVQVKGLSGYSARQEILSMIGVKSIV